jgi:hypothetical protein
MNTPQQTVGRRPRRPGVHETPAADPPGKKPDRKQDEADLGALVDGLYRGFASATGWAGWVLADEEVAAIARPASRILARNKQIDRAVKAVTDPLALAIAVVVPTGVRIMLFREELHARSARSVTPRPNMGQSAAPKPPPAAEPGGDPANGRAAATIATISALNHMP